MGRGEIDITSDALEVSDLKVAGVHGANLE